jgi:rhodanese-related sulfurtransferase
MTEKSPAELIAEAKTRIREVSVAEVASTLGAPNAPLLVDCREPKETNLGIIPGSKLVPLGSIEAAIGAVAARDAEIVVYCARGNRSALAADQMQNMGYTNVRSMAGGWMGWMDHGGPVAD